MNPSPPGQPGNDMQALNLVAATMVGADPLPELDAYVAELRRHTPRRAAEIRAGLAAGERVATCLFFVWCFVSILGVVCLALFSWYLHRQNNDVGSSVIAMVGVLLMLGLPREGSREWFLQFFGGAGTESITGEMHDQLMTRIFRRSVELSRVATDWQIQSGHPLRWKEYDLLMRAERLLDKRDARRDRLEREARGSLA